MRKLRNEELERLTAAEYKLAPKSSLVVILDHVRSLNNIGSVFRSCDAFRVEQLILCGITTPPPHREIHKSALGAELSVPWIYYDNTLDAVNHLLTRKFRIWAVEQTENSIPLQTFTKPPPDEPLALVFGHEIHGVSQDVIDCCHGSIEIPQYGTKHSFNIAVSVGIVLWEVTKNTYSVT